MDCVDDGGDTPALAYSIGDVGPSGVGIVFYVIPGGEHGLEAATVDQSNFQTWIEGGTTQSTLNGKTSTGLWLRLVNSNAIVAQTGHTGSASKVCRDYAGGGLTDWYLPSRDELNELYLQKDTVGGFANVDNWSSSEASSNDGWCQSFNSGTQSNINKSNNLRVRAIRAF